MDLDVKEKFSFEMELIMVMSVIGNIQLAVRHPGNSKLSAELARKAAELMIDKIREKNASLAATIDKDWDRRFDR